MTNENAIRVEGRSVGLRLDRFLCAAASVSLRSARRLVERGAVLVDDAPRQASYKLRTGQEVRIASSGGDIVQPQGARLIKAEGGFAAFFKPSGLHTASLSGAGGVSLESLLERLHPDGPVTLVNRLDQDTSGIVLGALDEASARRFRALEDLGAVDKRYLAVVTGELRSPLLLTWALNVDDRATVKALEQNSPDPLRFTAVRPLAHRTVACPDVSPHASWIASSGASGDGAARGPFPDDFQVEPGTEPNTGDALAGPLSQLGQTLVEARIAKGARHQIRAHLARAGFPILGDARYGGAGWPGLRLHHWKSTFAGFHAVALPQWPEWPDWISLEATRELCLEENTCASS